MICTGCGKSQQTYKRCEKCNQADNLNIEYLRAERAGDWERCRQIAIEILKLGVDNNDASC